MIYDLLKCLWDLAGTVAKIVISVFFVGLILVILFIVLLFAMIF